MRFCADGEVWCAQAEAKRPTRVNNPAHVITWMPMLIQLITQKIDPQIIARDWANSGNRPADVNRRAQVFSASAALRARQSAGGYAF